MAYSGKSNILDSNEITSLFGGYLLPNIPKQNKTNIDINLLISVKFLYIQDMNISVLVGVSRDKDVTTNEIMPNITSEGIYNLNVNVPKNYYVKLNIIGTYSLEKISVVAFMG